MAEIICVPKTTLLSYDELEIKTENNKIELVEYIKKQYIEYLKQNDNDNHKLIIATMCIQDLWRWIQQIGIHSIKENQHLLDQVNEFKNTQIHSESEQNEWQQFCEELEKTNISLKNEIKEYQDNIKNMKESYNTVCDEVNEYKNENQILLNKLEDLNNKYCETDKRLKQFEQKNSILTSNNQYLEQQKESIIKQHSIGIHKLKDQHKQEMVEMEALMNNSLKQQKEAPNQYYLTPSSVLSEIQEFENEKYFTEEREEKEEKEKKQESFMQIISRERSETVSMNDIDLNASDVEWTESDKKDNNDNVTLLYQIIKKQDQQLLSIKHQLDNAQTAVMDGVESLIQKQLLNSPKPIKETECLELYQSEYQHQHYYDDRNSSDLHEGIQKLQQIFVKYKLLNKPSDKVDLQQSIDLIESICQKYHLQRKQMDKLKRQNRKIKHDLTVTDKQTQQKKQKKPKKLKMKNSKSARKKVMKPRLKRATSVPIQRVHETYDYDDEDDSKISSTMMVSITEDIDEMDVLHNDILTELLSMMKYLRIVKNNNQYEYCIDRLQTISSSIHNLANEIDSSLLQNAAKVLNNLTTQICSRSNHYKCNNDELHDIINKTKNEISDLSMKAIQTKPSCQSSKAVAISRDSREQDLESLSDVIDYDEKNDYPHYQQYECEGYQYEIYDIYHGDNDDGDDGDDNHGDSMMKKDIPFIQSIEIDKKWFNKTPRAVIYYNGKTYKRKLSDFEWLWKVLLLTNDSGKSMPKLHSSLPSKQWYSGYVKKRQIELNKFLKHCHSIPWIRQSEPYFIFFSKTHKQWKSAKKKFSKNVSLISETNNA